jgi:N-acetylmuramoyl-L-alanine amidase
MAAPRISGLESSDGWRFHHFEILRSPDGAPWVLGHGSVGVTYKARDTGLNRIVALKVVDEGILADAAARSKFVEEARTAAALHHPNLAAIHYFGEEGYAYFYAMELVEGQSVEDYIRQHGPLPPQYALDVAAQVAAALGAAHDLGIVHRDVKPANIMLAPGAGGELAVKVVDFGLATPLTALSTGEASDHFAGTPLYASPEQLDGVAPDTRSDVYSLGAVLFFMLGGRPPFEGASIPELARKHTMQQVPVHLLAGVPLEVSTMVLGLLAKDPAARPADGAEARAAIEEIMRRHRHSAGRTAREWVQSRFAHIEQAGLLEGGILHKAAQTRGAEELAVFHFDNSARGLVAADRMRLAIPVVRSIKSPSARRVLDMADTADGLVVVCEWMSGTRLLSVLRVRRSLPPEEARLVLVPVAQALDEAAAAGMALPHVGLRDIFLQPVANAGTPLTQWPDLRVAVDLLPLAEAREIDINATVVGRSLGTPGSVAYAASGLDAASLVASLAYEILGGTTAPRAGFYVPLPELSENANRTLRRVFETGGAGITASALIGRLLGGGTPLDWPEDEFRRVEATRAPSLGARTFRDAQKAEPRLQVGSRHKALIGTVVLVLLLVVGVLLYLAAPSQVGESLGVVSSTPERQAAAPDSEVAPAPKAGIVLPPDQAGKSGGGVSLGLDAELPPDALVGHSAGPGVNSPSATPPQSGATGKPSLPALQRGDNGSLRISLANGQSFYLPPGKGLLGPSSNPSSQQLFANETASIVAVNEVPATKSSFVRAYVQGPDGVFKEITNFNSIVADAWPKSQFFNAYQDFQRAEKFQRDGRISEAVTLFRRVAEQLELLKAGCPDWQPMVVNFRMQKTREALARISTESPPLGPVDSSNHVTLGDNFASPNPHFLRVERISGNSLYLQSLILDQEGSNYDFKESDYEVRIKPNGEIVSVLAVLPGESPSFATNAPDDVSAEDKGSAAVSGQQTERASDAISDLLRRESPENGHGNKWQITRLGGREYIPLWQVALFYRMRVSAAADTRISLSSQTRSMDFSAGSREARIDGVVNWLSFPVVSHGGALYVARMDLAKTIDPLMRPQKIPGLQPVRNVLLDPGAAGSNSQEGFYNLEIAREVRKILTKSGLTASLTRNDDRPVTPEQRLALAGQMGEGAVFVGIHCEGAPGNGGSDTGCEIYTLTPRGAPDSGDNVLSERSFSREAGHRFDHASQALAASIYHAILGRLTSLDGAKEGGMKRARFPELSGAVTPATLVKCGSLANPQNARWLEDPQWRSRFADSIARGIVEYANLSRSKTQPKLLIQYRKDPAENSKPNPPMAAPQSGMMPAPVGSEEGSLAGRGTVPLQMANGAPQVDPLKPDDAVADVGSVWFLRGTTPQNPPILAQYELKTDSLVVRVDGKVERLKQKSAKWKPKREAGPKQGDELREAWANARVRVEISSILTNTQEGQNSYSGQMDVSVEGGKTISIAVDGRSGC